MTGTMNHARRWSVAMTTAMDADARAHLLRRDGQEDLTFGLWRPSTGAERTTAVLAELILPAAGERHVHGNASFEAAYFLRALGAAAQAGSGLALLHSHPGGRGFQGLSADDAAAEHGHTAQAHAVTGLPLLGLTLAGDQAWSARVWPRAASRTYVPHGAESVRVVGDRLRVTYDPAQRPRPPLRPVLARTVSAWGQDVQDDLARLRIGVIGAGSVGALVAEALARMGIQHLRLIDFDTVKDVNLDRLLHASIDDIGRPKVGVLAQALVRSATAASPRLDAVQRSVVEPDGLAAALDCDVLFSCVDRPWPRAVLNLAAYAHLIPVVDGGIAARVRGGRLVGADWRAHVAAPGRRCLECLGQYDPGLVQAEREGLLDDPSYISGLPVDHPLRRNENVFPFSMAAGSAEVLQLLSMVVAPCGLADVGAVHYHFVIAALDRDTAPCAPGCWYATRLLANGDHAGVTVTGRHLAAEQERHQR